MAGAARGANVAAGGGEPRRRDGASALLLVAHGDGGAETDRSRDGASRAASKLVDALSGDFAETRWSVLRGEPKPADALAGMADGIIHVVPLLMACGEVGGPLLRSRLASAGRSRLRVHPPIGAAPGLADLVCGRIKQIVRDRDFAPRETTVILAGHGSARNPASGAAVRRLAWLIRARGFPAADIRCAFLAEPPLLDDWRAFARRRNVIVIPCFLTAGRHARVDVPARLTAGAACDAASEPKRLWLAPPLAEDWRGLAALVRKCVLGTAVADQRQPG